MVDFSSREDVKRWLDAIKPAKRRREVAVALAARAALRATPLLGRELTRRRRPQAIILSDFVLPAFRATAVAWTAAKYPAHGRELRPYAAAAPGAGAATYAATYADADAPAAAAADAAAAATYAAAAAAAAAATYAAAAAAAADAAAADAALFDAGRSGSEVMGLPLWANGAPRWATERWRELRAALLAADEGWNVWTEWYEARLAGDAGHPPNEALEIACATIPDEIWKQGPAVVNAEIRRLIAEHQSLQQRPAAFQFRVIDDKIDALPDDARPIDARDARDLYDEAKRKALDLKDRLQRAQADVDLRAHVDLLLTRLGDSYSEMRPGLMLSVLRSLESDVRAYDSEEGRRELSAALLSSILDLAEGVRDLCAIFPRSREIEAEAVSLGLPLRRMPEIRSTIEDVIAKVTHSDGATEGGREAIDASATDLLHQRDLAGEAKQSAYFLVDFANFTRAGLKRLKSSGVVLGRELGGFSVDGWRAFRRGAPKGIERGAAQAGKALIVGGVAALMHALGSDIAALGTMAGAYVPLHELLSRMSAPQADTPAPESADPVDGDGNPPAPPAPAPRKPKTRRSPGGAKARKQTKP